MLYNVRPVSARGRLVHLKSTRPARELERVRQATDREQFLFTMDYLIHTSVDHRRLQLTNVPSFSQAHDMSVPCDLPSWSRG